MRVQSKQKHAGMGRAQILGRRIAPGRLQPEQQILPADIAALGATALRPIGQVLFHPRILQIRARRPRTEQHLPGGRAVGAQMRLDLFAGHRHGVAAFADPEDVAGLIQFPVVGCDLEDHQLLAVPGHDFGLRRA